MTKSKVQMALVPALIACAATRPTAGNHTPAEAIVQAQLDAYNQQDIDAFVKTYADEIVVTGGGKVMVQGKEALRERYQGMFRKFPKNRATITERRTEGDNVVVDHEIVTGRSPDKPDPWDVGWVRYEVANGLIQKVQLP